VRELSIVYWKDLDRALIFDEKMEKVLPEGGQVKDSRPKSGIR
jgi:hypothetical protein